MPTKFQLNLEGMSKMWKANDVRTDDGRTTDDGQQATT